MVWMIVSLRVFFVFVDAENTSPFSPDTYNEAFVSSDTYTVSASDSMTNLRVPITVLHWLDSE